MDSHLNKPKLSVVMIVHNGDTFIGRAIQSVLDQTYTNFEFLILNDGSTDLTENIVWSYQKIDKRIIYDKNETNKGLAYSRNKIIRNASSNYIIIADADDMSFKNRFQKQMDVMLSQPKIDILGSSVVLINDLDEQFDRWDYPTSDSEIKEGLKNGCIIANPSCIFKKEVFEKLNGYNQNLTICEDWDFFVRAAEHFQFCNLNEPLIYYRIHGNNISKNKLEPTVIYSIYLSTKIDSSCLGMNVIQVAHTFPIQKNKLADKAIQFYSFWIDTYAKIGYTKLSKELYVFVIQNYFLIFSDSQKQKFKKFCLSIFLKRKLFLESLKIFVHLVFKSCYLPL